MSKHLALTKDVNLKDRTYYQMGGSAQYFAEPTSFRELQNIIFWAREEKLPMTVLGSGSNVVFSDEKYQGIVITLSKLASWHWETPEILYAESGVTNTEVAEIALSSGNSGASWMFRMPGQLGGTVRMNARCFGGEISQIATEVMTIDTEGKFHCYKGSDVFFGYKDTSLMSSPEIVLAVRLHLPKTKVFVPVVDHMESCEQDRHSKHHFDFPSCGSAFKNNYAVGRPSGKVFDELGFKGTQIGQMQVSPYHGNFLYNLGNAKTTDMLALAGKMRTDARVKAQADLNLEVQPVGSFTKEQFNVCGMENLGPSHPEKNKFLMGLLWHPENPLNTPSLPNLLARLPFFEYFRKPHCGLAHVYAELTQLLPLMEAQKNPQAAFLRWQTVGDFEAFKLRPKSPAGSFVDELWKFSVSEIFFAHPQCREKYLEFEMTPQNHWVAIRFDGSRKRKQGEENLSEKFWPEPSFTEGLNQFGMDFSYETLKNVIVDSKIALQCCLSLGNNRYFLAPHWKQESNETWDTITQPSVTANFHQPERFVLVPLV